MLRDIALNYAYPPSREEMGALQARISAGGEMKTAIRRALDAYDAKGYINARHARALREAMEGWCNADLGEETPR